MAPLSKPDSEALLHFHDNADYKFELFSLQSPTQMFLKVLLKSSGDDKKYLNIGLTSTVCFVFLFLGQN